MHFIFEIILFFLAIGVILFLPGYTLIRAFFAQSSPSSSHKSSQASRTFSALEIFVFSLPLSIALVNFLIIAIGKIHTAITATSLVIGLAVLLGIIIGLSKLLKRKKVEELPPQKNITRDASKLSFTKRQGTLVLLILTLTICIKTIYLSQVILPTATDLGHHMYWSKVISETGTLPVYVERNIIEMDDAHATMTLGDPVAIDDFIIGEHLIFSAVQLLSKADYLSGFPILILLLVNIFTILACALLAVRGWLHFFQSSIAKPEETRRIAVLIFLLTLFLLGPLYTLASPQAKFVSGGVVGNTIGNLFLPCILYFYSRALTEKRSGMLALALFSTFGLAYIHHLSTLIFLFVFIATIIFFSLATLTNIKHYSSEWLRLFVTPAPLLITTFAILFFFGVLAPSYADPHSLNTAIGTPTKATRTGLSFLQFTYATGEGRLGLGLLGLIILFGIFLRSKLSSMHNSIMQSNYATWFIFSWGCALTIMSLRPQWVFLDIPSNRISSYAVFPFAILAAYAIIFLFRSISTPQTLSRQQQYGILSLSGLTIFTLLMTGGMYDNSQSLLSKTKAQEAVQTYAVSRYLASHTSENTLILKDHNYIVADSWMKLFFLRGYTYPLSRGYFKRYEDELKPREMCTLWMISVPNSDKGQKCFRDTGVEYVVVNPHFDSVQFHHSSAFDSVYQSNDIAVYKRK